MLGAATPLVLATLGFAAFEGTTTRVVCETSVAEGDGSFEMELHPTWAPKGVRLARFEPVLRCKSERGFLRGQVERTLALVEGGFFNNLPFFRMLPGFLVQFGISLDTNTHRHWQSQGNIGDDPRTAEQPPFRDGVISFAGSSIL